MDHLTRRQALKLVAGGVGAAATLSCAPSPRAAAADAVLSVFALGDRWHTQDPFLFCVHHDDRYPTGNDQFGPVASLAGRNIGSDFAGIDGWRMYHGDVVPGFPRHPHRGFETVTVVRRGLLDHADSLGAAARYGGGDVQWLTAGGGILHAEMFPLLNQSGPNPVELFQIWLNLPIAHKMVPAHFSMLWNEHIPRRIVRDRAGHTTELTVIAGRYGDAVPPSPPPNSWAAQAHSQVAIWTLKLSPGARFTLPAAPGANRTLYVFAGPGLGVAGQSIPARHGVALRGDVDVPLENLGAEVECLLLQGRPIGEPVVQHGPFVMSTRQEIQQAFADYRRTQFGGWPWERTDPVHGREGRFARHADGKVERPV